MNDMGAGKTPDAWTEAMQAKHGNGNGHGKSLSIEAQRLLPTPVAGDALGARNSTAYRSKEPPTGLHIGDTLTDIAWKKEGHHDPRMPQMTLQWGDYAAAIARWEHNLGRPAPAPTQTSAKGNPRLSARFSEWLMGLPDGWVTDPAIWEGMKPVSARNAQLKACGNGVVPQQAHAACLAFIQDMRTEGDQ